MPIKRFPISPWYAALALLLLVLIATRPSHDRVQEAPIPDEPTQIALTSTNLAGFDGAEIVVGSDGDYSSLAEAIAEARDGDRVVVRGGLHEDVHVTVDRSVQLVGEGWPILDGGGREGVLTITAHDVSVTGFVIRNTGVGHVRDHAAIRMERVSGCLIEGNRIEDAFFGIYLAQTTDCTVRGNTLRASGTRETNSGNGIHLWNVERTLVEGNDVGGHRDGIYLEFAKEAVIRDNLSAGNLRYGLHFMFSDDSVYERNVFDDNGAGVAVMYSRNVRMSDNSFTNNWGTAAYGLLLKEVQDSRIVDNLFRANTTAIYSEGADRLEFRGNRIERNGWAIKVQANSLDNEFTQNDFIENTFDVVTNSRRTSSTFNGNYWSRYSGYDLNGDGTGDLPYRPVRLFSFIVETKPMAIILLRSFFVDILDLAERVLPVLTPELLLDESPSMTPTT